jgi:hypothetical protein
VILPELLSACRSAGVELLLDGQAIRYRAPEGALTPDLREALKAYKPELAAALAAPPAWDAGRAGAVLAECERTIAAGLSSLTPAHRNVAEVYLDLARRYAERHDKLLWTMPDFLRGELTRWQGRRSIGLSAPVTASAPM